MNVLNAIGNVGRDAEIRHTPNGDTVAQFSFALTSGYGDKQITTWLNCNLWGKRADTLAPMLLKGTRIGITGELTNRPYTDKAGVEKHSLEVRVSDVTLLGKKDGDSVATQPKTARPNEQNDGTGFDDMASDIPFINIYRGKRVYAI
jgi:single-strand DNA-binding protein